MKSKSKNNFTSEFSKGLRVAEGGRYDDLVRKYRPPGNFASALTTFYTNAPIPICVGVRFYILKMVESIYEESHLALQSLPAEADLNRSSSDAMAVEILRKSLGHPLLYSTSVQALVASANGLDASSASDRLVVASHLWADGISAEWSPQSGVMSRLLKMRGKDEETGSEWSLEDLCGFCSIMKVPYVVIVQPHLLRDKGHVRLRHIMCDSVPSGNSPTETFVPLDSLATTISTARPLEDQNNEQADGSQSLTLEGTQGGSRGPRPKVECIYIDHDQFFSNEKQLSKSDTTNWKAVMKVLKSVSQRSEAYLDSLTGPTRDHGAAIIALNLSFWILRDVGTTIMRQSQSSTGSALAELTERYPKHKKVLKTLSMAIDSTMKANGFWSRNGEDSEKKGQFMNFLLYSKCDDRFDLISLGEDSLLNEPVKIGKHSKKYH